MADSPKPYALLRLDNLKSVKFDTIDELKNGIQDMDAPTSALMALRYHASASQYVPMEIAGRTRSL